MTLDLACARDERRQTQRKPRARGRGLWGSGPEKGRIGLVREKSCPRLCPQEMLTLPLRPELKEEDVGKGQSGEGRVLITDGETQGFQGLCLGSLVALSFSELALR